MTSKLNVNQSNNHGTISVTTANTFTASQTFDIGIDMDSSNILNVQGLKFVKPSTSTALDSDGNVTLSGQYVIVDTYLSASTDDLNHDYGTGDGLERYYRSANDSRDITVIDFVGFDGSFLSTGDFTLTDVNDLIGFVILYTNEGNSFWSQISQSDNDT